MKNKKIRNQILLLALLSAIKTNCYQTITFFMRPYPTITSKEIAICKAKKLNKLSKASKYVFRSFTKPFLASGIFCTYGGNSTITDLNGQATFIRTHKKPLVNIIITKNIVPILSLENTVHHWEISRARDVKMYTIEKKFDTLAKTYFWDTKKAPKLEDNIIPLHAIVIFADPKYIYIPTGITLTTKSPQLVLPDIYVKPGINKVKSALMMFNIKNLVSATNTLYKKEKSNYSKHIKN